MARDSYRVSVLAAIEKEGDSVKEITYMEIYIDSVDKNITGGAILSFSAMNTRTSNERLRCATPNPVLRPEHQVAHPPKLILVTWSQYATDGMQETVAGVAYLPYTFGMV